MPSEYAFRASADPTTRFNGQHFAACALGSRDANYLDIKIK